MARDTARLTRRDLLSAATGAETAHISSAVVLARPEQTDAVVGRLSREPGVEVHGRNGPRIVVVMEAPTAGRLGEMLNWITLMEGVISAAMVYEQRDVPAGAAS
jgi:nitrate reductase NapD